MTSTSRQTPTGAALACCAAILLATLTRPLLAEDLTFRFTTTVDASSVGRTGQCPAGRNLHVCLGLAEWHGIVSDHRQPWQLWSDLHDAPGGRSTLNGNGGHPGRQ